MAEFEYVIVGAEVDEAKRYVKPDGTIIAKADAGQDDIPLNVEYIGALLVRLSQLGKEGVPAVELARYENEVKYALQVRRLTGSGSTQLNDLQESIFLDGTTVSIEFETRETSQKETDRNRRILVVPSDNTLKIAEKAYLTGQVPTGFEPPLTYDLDRALMLASLSDTIQEIVSSFSNHPQSTPELQAALKAHVAERIAGLTTFLAEDGTPADSVLNEILHSPVRAFHRSVGIYATNMCR